MESAPAAEIANQLCSLGVADVLTVATPAVLESILSVAEK